MSGWTLKHQKTHHKIFLKVNDFEITKREVIASITIFAVMLLIGFFISGKIQDNYLDKYSEYNKALHITDKEIFQYGMNTNIGNSFVFGDLEALDTVSLPELEGEYLYLNKVEEHYNRHTRTVTKTVNGKKQTKTEVYYTWDYHDNWETHSEKIKFCGVEFDYNKIKRPDDKHIKTEKSFLSNVRFQYYACDTQYTGTIYTKLFNGTIIDGTEFYNNMDIEQTLEGLTSNIGIWIFWILWILLIVAAMFGFYYLDNNWLES